MKEEYEGTVFLISMVLMAVFGIYYSRRLKSISFSKKYYQKVILYLSRYEYFRNLSEENKKRFSGIIKRFNKRLNYHGRDGVVITEEIRIIIAAGYAKLSLGNDFGNFYKFRSIVVFPRAYRDEEKKSRYLGKTSLEGYISLSWEDILKSEADLHDGINLALHEFSHAIVVEMMSDQINFELEYSVVRHIYFTAKHEIEKFKKGEEMDMRKYAYSSPHEFFSIAVEWFFETPEKLIRSSWITYRNLCVLFRQNPLRNEIGKINWDWILDYPHEERHLRSSIETKTYGVFDFYPYFVSIGIDPEKSLIKLFQGKKIVRTSEILHKSVLFVTKKYIPPSRYTSEEYQVIFFLFRNNDVDKIIFSTWKEKPAEEVIGIYRKIGLAY